MAACCWKWKGVARDRSPNIPRGDQGFGYDPIFEVEGTGLTFAEMPLAEKKQHGHRGRAFTALEPQLRQLLESG